jgi:hypothetical protein
MIVSLALATTLTVQNPCSSEGSCSNLTSASTEALASRYLPPSTAADVQFHYFERVGDSPPLSIQFYSPVERLQNGVCRRVMHRVSLAPRTSDGGSSAFPRGGHPTTEVQMSWNLHCRTVADRRLGEVSLFGEAPGFEAAAADALAWVGAVRQRARSKRRPLGATVTCIKTDRCPNDPTEVLAAIPLENFAGISQSEGGWLLGVSMKPMGFNDQITDRWIIRIRYPVVSQPVISLERLMGTPF